MLQAMCELRMYSMSQEISVSREPEHDVHNCEIRNRQWQCPNTIMLVSASAAL